MASHAPSRAFREHLKSSVISYVHDWRAAGALGQGDGLPSHLGQCSPGAPVLCSIVHALTSFSGLESGLRSLSTVTPAESGVDKGPWRLVLSVGDVRLATELWSLAAVAVAALAKNKDEAGTRAARAFQRWGCAYALRCAMERFSCVIGDGVDAAALMKLESKVAAFSRALA